MAEIVQISWKLAAQSRIARKSEIICKNCVVASMFKVFLQNVWGFFLTSLLSSVAVKNVVAFLIEQLR